MDKLPSVNITVPQFSTNHFTRFAQSVRLWLHCYREFRKTGMPLYAALEATAIRRQFMGKGGGEARGLLGRGGG